MINPVKKRCPIFGCLLEKYPNNGKPKLGIVFGATTIAVDDNIENRKPLKLPCQD